MNRGVTSALVCLFVVGVGRAQVGPGAAQVNLPSPCPPAPESVADSQPIWPVPGPLPVPKDSTPEALAKAFEEAHTKGFEDFTGKRVKVELKDSSKALKLNQVTQEESPWLGAERQEDVALIEVTTAKNSKYSLFFVFSGLDTDLRARLRKLVGNAEDGTFIQGWCFGRQTWYGESEGTGQEVRRIVFRDCELLLTLDQVRDQLRVAQKELRDARNNPANPKLVAEAKQKCIRIAGFLFKIKPGDTDAIKELVERFKEEVHPQTKNPDQQALAAAKAAILAAFPESSKEMMEALAKLLNDKTFRDRTIELLSKIKR